MKILAISDVHGEDNENFYKYLNNNDIDIVIITGDITNFGPLEFVDEFIASLGSWHVCLVELGKKFLGVSY